MDDWWSIFPASIFQSLTNFIRNCATRNKSFICNLFSIFSGSFFTSLTDPTRSIIFLGTFQFLKQRPEHNLAYIHSKPVVYVNNGGGRDTYISNSSGGLRSDYRPAHGSRTFYSNLRQYNKVAMPNRGSSHTATMADKRDILSNT